MSRLAVVTDGKSLPDDQARPIWERFSAHMEAHRGDFEGFARLEGYAHAKVAVHEGVPTLTLTGRKAISR
ncbi:MAG TPA: hypothetical protein VFB62_04250 [Polyangiaceae bacterium]|jgi:hypothetical protein|nr:hypothetical protein [Polyangiaceae bacterium]